MKDEPNWYEQDAMSVNSTPTSPESERKKTTSESMSSDKGDKGQVWTWFWRKKSIVKKKKFRFRWKHIVQITCHLLFILRNSLNSRREVDIDRRLLNG